MCGEKLNKFLLGLLVGVLMWSGQSFAAEIQYRLSDNRVTGFLQNGSIPQVEGHNTAIVPDDFLTTLAVPQQCVGSMNILKSLVVTSVNPVVVSVDVGLECFQGIVVTTKQQLDALALDVIRKRLPEFRAYVAEKCPVVDVTAKCQRFRAVAQQLDPVEADIDQLIQDALSVRSRLP